MYNVGVSANENNLSSKAANPPPTCEQVATPWLTLTSNYYIYIYTIVEPLKGLARLQEIAFVLSEIR